MSLKHAISTIAVAATPGVLISSTALAENAITAPGDEVHRHRHGPAATICCLRASAAVSS